MATHHHHHHPHPAPNQPKHTGEQLGVKLAAILNHGYGADPNHQAAQALLALRQNHYHAEDVKRLMTAAFANKGMPPGLRAMIAEFLITEWWPTQRGADDGQALYGDAADFALDIFHRSPEQRSDLGWSPAELIKRTLDFFDEELDRPLIEQIQTEQVADDAEAQPEESN
jgi:hypothetical protein